MFKKNRNGNKANDMRTIGERLNDPSYRGKEELMEIVASLPNIPGLDKLEVIPVEPFMMKDIPW